MPILEWHTICPGGESVHLSNLILEHRPRLPAHKHDFYECFLVESGRGRHRLPDGESSLRPGDFHCLRPEHVHAVRGAAPDKPVYVINVAFAAPVFESLAERFPFPLDLWRKGHPPWHTRLTDTARARFRNLTDELAHGGRKAVDAAWFLLGLQRIFVAGDRGRTPVVENLPDWLAQALPLAIEPENLRGGLPTLLRLCGRSQEHVTRVFTKRLGTSPTRWLNRERLLRARRLLETTRLPMVEIALESGFQSQSYFHRLFRQTYGQTPLRYRRRAQAVQIPVE